MIDSSLYSLDAEALRAVNGLLSKFGTNPTLEDLWILMDQAWEHCGCDNRSPEPVSLARFYNDPVWLLNGMFIEQHAVSMAHRKAITFAVGELAPQRVIDFGGGFGTLARLMATALPQAEIEICEPFPPRHGIESCKPFRNIVFVPKLISQSVDVLVSTDVLEHVPDPLALLASMVDSVRLGGHLFIANCFYPVIACHLPCNFHLRDSFDQFCLALGLQVLGPCEGSHATVYKRIMKVDPNWPHLRAMERRSQQRFVWMAWKAKLSLGQQRLPSAIVKPIKYLRKLVRVIWTSA